MARAPPLLDPIYFDPRPSTVVLAKASKVQALTMSTSASLQPRTELNSHLSLLPRPNFDEEPVEYPQFLLFGDSITQFSTLTLQAYLQTQYIRRLDVINRGYSGFTSPMGYHCLQKFLPLRKNTNEWPIIKLMTIFFGANDAAPRGQAQHVELQTYVDTLKSIIQYPILQRQDQHKTNVILITPPPINEHQFDRNQEGSFSRRAGLASQYAQAAARVGKTYGVCVLDFWSILMQKVGWKESMGRDCCCEHQSCHLESRTALSHSEIRHIPGCILISDKIPNAEHQLSDFLVDGLHLTKLGYDILFLELMKLIRDKMPKYAPESLPLILPEWRDALDLMND